MTQIELRIFNKRRVANILSFVVILWTLWLWSQIILSILDNTYIDVVHKDLLLTMVSVLTGASGFASKHIYDVCSDD